jgi:hypothetical protein
MHHPPQLRLAATTHTHPSPSPQLHPAGPPSHTRTPPPSASTTHSSRAPLPPATTRRRHQPTPPTRPRSPCFASARPTSPCARNRRPNTSPRARSAPLRDEPAHRAHASTYLLATAPAQPPPPPLLRPLPRAPPSHRSIELAPCHRVHSDRRRPTAPPQRPSCATVQDYCCAPSHQAPHQQLTAARLHAQQTPSPAIAPGNIRPF